MSEAKFKPGEYIIYQNGDSFEIGMIKRICDDGAFVWYSGGETAAKTPFDCMHKIINAYAIVDTELGGLDGKPAQLTAVEDIPHNCKTCKYDEDACPAVAVCGKDGDYWKWRGAGKEAQT